MRPSYFFGERLLRGRGQGGRSTEQFRETYRQFGTGVPPSDTVVERSPGLADQQAVEVTRDD